MTDTRIVTLTGTWEADLIIGPDCDGGKEPRRLGLITLDIDGQLFTISDAQMKSVLPESLAEHMLNYYPDELMNLVEELDAHEHEEHLKGKADDFLHERGPA